MVKAYKRISKRELKEDKFISYTLKAKEYVENNSRMLTWLGVGIVVVILLVSFLARSKRQANLQANELLGQASFAFNMGNVQQAEEQMKQLIENYQGVTAAGQGCFFLAKYYWQQSDYENARLYFKKYLDDYADDKLLTSSAFAGYADCLLQTGDVRGAADNYQKAAETGKDSPLVPSYLYSAARAFMEAGDFERSRNMAQKLIEDHADSEYKNKAEILLNMIKLKS